MKYWGSVVCIHSLAVAVLAADPPAPHGAVPSTAQLAWHEMQFYGFIHFTMNTFTDREWGQGDEAESLFNPSELDCRQWARVAKNAGMAGLILTAKHHDGFCLWPSEFTQHAVKNSPWKSGKGDVVRELSDACGGFGLKFGVYLSPWDCNHTDYGKPAYITFYRNQVRELLTNYGPIFEFWVDGANGGKGYYGGAREARTIDRATYYDWENTNKLVLQLAPQAIIFSDVGPGCRWIGNEAGYAGDPCWATYSPRGISNPDKPAPGDVHDKEGENGHKNGKHWLPAEVDVSIRPGWFYHAKEDDQVKSPKQLLEIYYNSVGRGANLLLNVPPDRRGLIHENDAKSLLEFGRIVRETFARDLARGAKATASVTRGGDARFAASAAADGDPQTYWATDDGVTTGEVVLAFEKPITFDVIRVREFIALGQRVEAFAIDVDEAGSWRELAKGTTIGPRRLLRVSPTTSSRVRLRVSAALACPAISEFALFRQP